MKLSCPMVVLTTPVSKEVTSTSSGELKLFLKLPASISLPLKFLYPAFKEIAVTWRLKLY